jgi:hypothetical protein
MESKLTVLEAWRSAVEAALNKLWEEGELPCPYQVLVSGSSVIVNVEGSDENKVVFQNWLQDLAHVTCNVVDPRPVAALDNEPIEDTGEQFGGRPVSVELITEDAFQAVVGDAFEDARSKFVAGIQADVTALGIVYTGSAVKTLFYERYSPGILLKTAFHALAVMQGKESNDAGPSQGISFTATQDLDQKFYGKEFPADGVDDDFQNILTKIRLGEHCFEFDAVSGKARVQVVRSLVKDDERNGQV